MTTAALPLFKGPITNHGIVKWVMNNKKNKIRAQDKSTVEETTICIANIYQMKSDEFER